MIRTPHQTAANRIDLELFRLLDHVETIAAQRRASGDWAELCAHLRSARACARAQMHFDDRSGT